MMTDEKFIEWLRKIKEHCEKNCANKCSGCKFRNDTKKGRTCVLNLLAYNLSFPPIHWNMEEIERIIKL